jgi:hypothetical protein
MWVMHALLPVMEIVDLVMVAHGQYSSMSRGDAEGRRGTTARRPSRIIRWWPPCVAAGLSHVPSRWDLVASLELIEDEVTAAVRRGLRQAVEGDYRARRDVLEDRAPRSAHRCRGTSRLTTSCALPERVVMSMCAIRCWHCCSTSPRMMRLCSARPGPAWCTASRTPRAGMPARWPPLWPCFRGADGDGAAALVAVDRSLDADPANTLGPLVAHALENGTAAGHVVPVDRGHAPGRPAWQASTQRMRGRWVLVPNVGSEHETCWGPCG